MIVLEDATCKLEFAIDEKVKITGVYRIRQETEGRETFPLTRFQKVSVDDGYYVESLTNFDRSFNADTTVSAKKQVEEIFSNLLGGMPCKISSTDFTKSSKYGEHTFTLVFKKEKDDYIAEVKTMMQK